MEAAIILGLTLLVGEGERERGNIELAETSWQKINMVASFVDQLQVAMLCLVLKPPSIVTRTIYSIVY